MGVIIIFLLALALRLFLAPFAFHVDILSNAAWGQWIYLHGPLGFYENNVWIYSWPTQPPFVSLLYGFDNWFYIFLLQTFRSIGNTIVQYHLAPGHLRFWFNFTKWFDTAKVDTESVFSIGYLTSIKILPIFSDLGIAGLIYWAAKSVKRVGYPLVWSGIYLFSPFSWYLSALWGQYDPLSYLPLLIAFILESRKKASWLTPFLFALSVATKPTSLILAPLFIYIYFKNSPKKLPLIISVALISIFYFLTTRVFTTGNVIDFSKNVLVGKIFFKASSRLSANAFNFWRIFQTNGGETHDALFLFIPAFFWSLASYVFLNILAIKKLEEVNLKNVMIAMFMVSAGGWIFMTDMLDRYFFAGVVTGLILCIWNKRLFKYWFIVSLIFWINLFNQWFYPPFLDPLRLALIWNGGILTKVLSLITVVTFIRIIYLLKNEPAPESIKHK